MKVIFLDIDGVLNTSNTFDKINDEYNKTGNRRIALDEFRIEILSKIIDKTNAKIVLSSSFRFGFERKDDKIIPVRKDTIELINIFNKYGIEIYDITGIDENCIRKNEINEWLSKRNDIDSFVIIDDDTGDLKEFIDNGLVKTNFFEKEGIAGLSDSHVEEIVCTLNKNEKILKKIK